MREAHTSCRRVTLAGGFVFDSAIFHTKDKTISLSHPKNDSAINLAARDQGIHSAAMYRHRINIFTKQITKWDSLQTFHANNQRRSARDPEQECLSHRKTRSFLGSVQTPSCVALGGAIRRHNIGRDIRLEA